MYLNISYRVCLDGFGELEVFLKARKSNVYDLKISKFTQSGYFRAGPEDYESPPYFPCRRLGASGAGVRAYMTAWQHVGPGRSHAPVLFAFCASTIDASGVQSNPRDDIPAALEETVRS